MQIALPKTFLGNLISRGTLLICLLALTSARIFAQATVQTDKSDYPPGSTVYITGSGFQANEQVTLQVLHTDTTSATEDGSSPAHQPWTVTADGSGNISSTWLVPLDEDELNSALQLTAVGQTSGLTAKWTFTDANPSWTVTSVSGTYGQSASVTLTATLSNSANHTPTFTITNSANHTVFTGTPASNTTVSGHTVATLTYYLTSDGSAYIQGTNTLLPAGSYTITASGSGTTSGSNTLTVAQAALTITAKNQTKTYGTVFTFAGTEFTTSGLLGSDAVTSVTLTSPGTAATATVSGSPYA
ncbi:MAG: hypothetical protein JSU01_05800, partial [Bacteroidetes bacterium]|nr:hypothetical protein [Bacteroidota bacterium]